ncbi:MAG: hypothetical protein Q9219_004385 [cf. Caloplaca sp. 3 TL-2023]
MPTPDFISSTSSLTFSSSSTPVPPSSPPSLRLLHFNDVYHIEPSSSEPIGGIARFQTLRDYYADDVVFEGKVELVTLFSGDAFNPSLESSVTKGAHMVGVLNGVLGKEGKGVACVGNHDLDFGVPQFRHLRNQCTFPWLLANVLDPALGEDVALANCEKTMIVEASNGVKIGLIGLAEREWLDTINALPPNLIYKSASETAKALIPPLRAQGADIIIALTHAREPSDVKLADRVPPGLIDLILGGHDHIYSHQIVNGTHILRSGTDFKQLSYIEAFRPSTLANNNNNNLPPTNNQSNKTPPTQPPSPWALRILRHDITRAIPPSPTTVSLLSHLTASLTRHLETPIGYTFTPLDARFSTVRARESNLGNFVADLMRHYYAADCAIMAGGTIRGDCVYPPGLLRLRDLMACFPFEDPVIVVRVRGRAVRRALENGVSLLPALEGRFPQVSGVRFAFDASSSSSSSSLSLEESSSSSRVKWIEIASEPLEDDKLYTLATRGYMGRGKDGFSSLLVKSEGGDAEEVVSEENGVLISTILRQYFLSLTVLRKWRGWGESLGRHWGVVCGKLHGADGGAVEVVEPEELRGGDGHSKSGGGDEGGEGEDEDGGMVVDEAVLARREEERRGVYRARWAVRRWMRAVGLKREDVAVVDEHDEKAPPDWTRGIAPRVEGRIVVVNG